MRIAQITDLHIDNCEPELAHLDARAKLVSILDDIAEKGINEVVFTGDLIESEDGLTWFENMLSERKIKSYFVFGNHDKPAEYAAVNTCNSGGYYFHLQIENFICLFADSSGSRIDSGQLEWMKSIIENSSRQVVLFIHHPVLDCGGSMMDRLHALQNRAELEKFLMSLDSQISVFCGHYHTECVVQRGNITQFVTPSVLYQLKKYSAHPEIENVLTGYRIIDFNGGMFITEVIFLP